jgi:hypothetical protein
MLVFRHSSLGKEKWTNVIYDNVFVPSSCQAEFYRNSGSFSNVVIEERYASPVYFWRPTRFDRKSLTWWFRACARFLFRPDLERFPFDWTKLYTRFQFLAQNATNQPSPLNATLCNTFGVNFSQSRSCSFTEIARQILSLRLGNAESVNFAVHIRQGDSCTHRITTNKHRPSCQGPEEYAKWLLGLLVLISNKRLPLSVFILTDTQSAADSFIKILNSSMFALESGFSQIVCHQTAIDREKYKVPYGQDMVVAVSKNNVADFYHDFIADLMIFATSDHIVGQCFSSFMSLGVILNDDDSHTCIDASFVTIRGGSPNPYPLDEAACNEMNVLWGVEAHQSSAPLFYKQWYNIVKVRNGADFCKLHLLAPCYADIHVSSFMLQFTNTSSLVRSHHLPQLDTKISKEQQSVCF